MLLTTALLRGWRCDVKASGRLARDVAVPAAPLVSRLWLIVLGVVVMLLDQIEELDLKCTFA